MKAVIPVAGAGMHLRPLTQSQPKALVPVAGKAIIGHIIDNLLNTGINEFVFIIGYLSDKIEHYIQTHYPHIKAEFVLQKKREGLGHAIWESREYLNNEDEILIVLGDTMFDMDLKYVLDEPYSTLGVHKVSSPGLFGIAEVNAKGRVVKLVEKPSMPKSNLALVGLYKILQPSKLISALEYNISKNIRTNNEFHLTDGLMRLIDGGEIFTTFTVDNWYDCGKKEILLKTNKIFLQRPGLATTVLPEYPNTIIIQPVNIAPDCNISSSIIGPFVTISEHSTMEYSIITDSIIGAYSIIKNAVLQQTIVGSDSSVKGFSHSLNIGDNSEIYFE